MLRKGGIVDTTRSATWFIKWWREEGCQAAASTPLLTSLSDDISSRTPPDAPFRRGWGFDLEWSVEPSDLERYDEAMVQAKMEECIDEFERELVEEEKEGGGVSSTQLKKRVRDELLAKRAVKSKARLVAKKGSR